MSKLLNLSKLKFLFFADKARISNKPLRTEQVDSVEKLFKQALEKSLEEGQQYYHQALDELATLQAGHPALERWLPLLRQAFWPKQHDLPPSTLGNIGSHHVTKETYELWKNKFAEFYAYYKSSRFTQSGDAGATANHSAAIL